VVPQIHSEMPDPLAHVGHRRLDLLLEAAQLHEQFESFRLRQHGHHASSRRWLSAVGAITLVAGEADPDKLSGYQLKTGLSLRS